MTGEDFFDREDILERLKAERNFALIGQRKVGKTSIILEYLSRNPDPQVFTSYIYILFEDTPPAHACGRWSARTQRGAVVQSGSSGSVHSSSRWCRDRPG